MKKATSPSNTVVDQAAEVPANLAGAKPERNLFVQVVTFNADNKEIGSRIVDMYHFGTRNWLQSHHWWAMHNAHTVETRVATQDEVSDYLAAQKAALVAKFAPDVAHTASA